MTQDKDIGTLVERKVFHQTYDAGELDSYMIQKPYKLHEVDFLHLKSKDSWTGRAASLFLNLFIGYLILVAAKWIYWMSTKKTESEPLGSFISWEIIALIASLIIGVLVWLVAWMMNIWKPSNKKMVTDKIDKHFKDNPGRNVIGRDQ